MQKMKTRILFFFYLFIIQSVYSQANTFYGVTAEGGVNNDGVIFQYNYTTNTYTKKFDFNNFISGREPVGGLTLANNGKLYGLTYHGGINSSGVLFEYDPINDAFTKKVDFSSALGDQGLGKLIKAKNGKLYGLTYYGGANNRGVLFEYDPDTNIYSKKYEFKTSSGTYPSGSLLQASNNKLYGLTSMGGQYSNGTLFEFDINTNSYSVLVHFYGNTNGSQPVDYLVQASNGKLYAMTSIGGVNNHGVLFEYTISTNTFRKIIDFYEPTTGYVPLGSLNVANNGKLYGLTPAGGAYDGGTLFEYDIQADSFAKKIDFGTSNDGTYNSGTLIQGSNGKLLGMALEGGLYNYGTLYEYDPVTNVYAIRYHFKDIINGVKPHISELVEYIPSYMNAEDVYGKSDVKIFPNPIKNTINIESKEDITKNEIYSLEGKLIPNINQVNYNKIDVSKLSKGNYILKIHLRNGTSVTRKFIKE